MAIANMHRYGISLSLLYISTSFLCVKLLKKSRSSCLINPKHKIQKFVFLGGYSDFLRQTDMSKYENEIKMQSQVVVYFIFQFNTT